MGKKRQTVDAWTHMMQLMDADIHPAMLEAFDGEFSALKGFSSNFFQQAVEAMVAAQTATGPNFESLFRERKIALIDYILEIGVETFTQQFPGSNWNKDSLISTIEAGTWKMKDERKKTRIVNSMIHDRLVFGQDAINTLRSMEIGKSINLYAQPAPAVDYVRRLLQVAHRMLAPEETKPQPHESGILPHTTENLRRVKDLLGGLNADQMIDRYALARLEFIKSVSKSKLPGEKSKAATQAEKDSIWANVIGNKALWIKIGFDDFDKFMDFYRDLHAGKRPKLKPGELPDFSKPLKPSSLDFKDKKETPQNEEKEAHKELREQLKYLLGPIQKESQESFDVVKQWLDGQLKQATAVGTGLVKDLMKNEPVIFWGGVGLLLGVGGLLTRIQWNRAKAGNDQGIDPYVTIQEQLKLAKIKKVVSNEEIDSGLRVWRNKITLEAYLDDPNKSFSGAQKDMMGGQAGMSINWTQFKNLPPAMGLPGLMAHGFADGHFWYCPEKGAFYQTFELRSRIQSGEIATSVKVRDLNAKEPKDTPISEFPILVKPLVSSTPKFSLTGGVVGGYARSPHVRKTQDKDLTHLGGHVDFSAGAFSANIAANAKRVAQDGLPVPHDQSAVILGMQQDLECTLRLKCPTGPNTLKATNKVEVFAGGKYTHTRFPDDLNRRPSSIDYSQLESEVLSTQAGATWNVIHRDKSSLKLSLLGEFSWEESEAKGTQDRQTVKSRMEYTGRRLTMTADVNWLPQASNPSAPLSGALRLLWSFK